MDVIRNFRFCAASGGRAAFLESHPVKLVQKRKLPSRKVISGFR